jgi:hypothetical protein
MPLNSASEGERPSASTCMVNFSPLNWLSTVTSVSTIPHSGVITMRF